MGFFSFLLLGAMTYFLWRISSQLPDVLYRLSEIQRDVADLRNAEADEPALPEDSDQDKID
ncbi:MAG TPA: hypothetical protein DER02_02325 [Gammaproteobacteria bacterium]|nr:hypothetical protein [Gammaproteobacteria bacterium]|tara:strand:+ start:21945 stop:22127 length:183 start_codon:yes stop_codon:yes gene_type:complete